MSILISKFILKCFFLTIYNLNLLDFMGIYSIKIQYEKFEQKTILTI